jgi:RNA recognition motif-containing protein
VSIVGKSQVSGAKIATDSYAGRSRGLAFVEMENAADADRARAALGVNSVEAARSNSRGLPKARAG